MSTVALVQAVERLQRAMPRNPEVIALGQALSSAMAEVRNVTLPLPSLRNVTPSAECSTCAARRAQGAERVKRHRAKAV
jgi:hypothetical protein